MSTSTAGGLRTRKDVSSLGKPGDDLDWYAKAVAELQNRPLADPTGWRYLGAVHGYPGHAKDPLAHHGDKLPSAADRKKFWAQCQHQTWFFLPWHRGYLACFEEIVAAAVVKLGGPAGWALPYWNYSAPAAHGAPDPRSLPPAFLDRLKPDGSANALWLAGRAMTSAADLLPAGDVDLSALLHSPFAGGTHGGDPGFGGPNTGFSHFGGVNGRLENLPHNQIHDDVGGLMGDPDTAALDPIFWLHHSNIDRLWEVWRARDATFTDPSVPAWLTGVTFELHDATGAVVSFTASQMRDPATVRHGYRYDDISDPFATTAAPAGLAVMTQAAQTPALVGASQTATAIGGPSTSVRVSFHQPSRQAAIARLGGARPVRAFLNLENVTGTGRHGGYEVYVDVPAGPAAAAGMPLLAGHLSTFGVDKASQPGQPHGGSGITTVLEITPLVQQLHQDRNWDGEHLDVTFVPKASAKAASGSNLRVGRVSIYYA